MNTIDILRELSHIPSFAGVYCRDNIPNIKKRPASIVINYDSCKEAGSHWVAILLFDDGRGEFFDSFGLAPLHPDIYRFLEDHCPLGYIHNSFQFQSPRSDTCGDYIILYIKRRSQGYTFLDFLNSFTSNKLLNDDLVKIF